MAQVLAVNCHVHRVHVIYVRVVDNDGDDDDYLLLLLNEHSQIRMVSLILTNSLNKQKVESIKTIDVR